MTLTPRETKSLSRMRSPDGERVTDSRYQQVLTPDSSSNPIDMMETPRTTCLSRDSSSMMDESTMSQAGGCSASTSPATTVGDTSDSCCLELLDSSIMACETPPRRQQRTHSPATTLSQAKTTPVATPISVDVVQVQPSVSYRLGELLGQAAASVYRATVISSNVTAAARGSQVAVKIYNTSTWKSDQYRFARSEIKIMSQMDHPNIVKFHSCEYEGCGTSGNFRATPPRRNNNLYGYGTARRSRSTHGCGSSNNPQITIVQELCEKKDLFHNVAKYGAMPAALAAFYYRKLLKAIAYMHSQRVAHRDLKLENLVFDKNYCLKVCDFGHATTWEPHVQKPKEWQCTGTQRYRLPEVQKLARPVSNTTRRGGQGATSSCTPVRHGTSALGGGGMTDGSYDPRQSDTWAAAVVFFELLLGYPPMSNACANSDWYYHKIANGLWDKFWGQHEKMCKSKGAKQLAKLTPNMRKFFQQAFEPDPAKRPSLRELLEHEYLLNSEQGHEELNSLDDARTTLSDAAVLTAMRVRCR